MIRIPELGVATLRSPPGNKLHAAVGHAVGRRQGTRHMQTALAWLLRRAANILFIPGHLAAAELQLPGNAMSRLNAMQSKG